jgi:hypothetical protein
MNNDTPPLVDHQQIQLLLPWYLNQTLTENERVLVEDHLHSCLLCKRELMDLRKLAAAINQNSNLDEAAELSLADLKPRLQREPGQLTIGLNGDAEITGDHRGKRFANRFIPAVDLNIGRSKYFAIAASLLLVVAPFAMKLRHSETANPYFTLATDQRHLVSGKLLHVVFVKSLPENRIEALLAQIHGIRIDTPNSVGAYTVKLDVGQDKADVSKVLNFLRNQPEVLLAEPVLEH